MVIGLVEIRVSESDAVLCCAVLCCAADWPGYQNRRTVTRIMNDGDQASAHAGQKVRAGEYE